MKQKLIIGVLLMLLGVQFISLEKNVSKEVSGTDIGKVLNVPSDVLEILHVACYDCHSNNTIYPWYANVQPVGWWINRHIKGGKRHLNFSEFGTYPSKKANHKLHEIAEVIEEGEMPMFSYTLMHANAKLSQAQQQLLIKWAKGVSASNIEN